MKQLEQITLEELFGSTISGSFPALLDITHDALDINDGIQEPGHFRLINSNTAVKYKGYKYVPAFFEFTAPDEDGKKIGQATITISAIDQSVIKMIRTLRTAPKVTIIAFFSKLDESRYVFSKLGSYTFEMKSVNWDDKTAKWNLSFDPVSQTNVPRAMGTKTRCPSVCENQ